MDPIDWLLGDDTGKSSKTLFAVMLGKEYSDPSVPLDAGDFGRCHRLLEAFPEWRQRLPEVAAKHLAWGPLVREWDALTALYKSKSRLYERLQPLIDEGRVADGWERTDYGWHKGDTTEIQVTPTMSVRL